MARMRIIVIGAGLGGLTLAHALRRHGVEVAVYERDRTPDERPDRYRIHLNPAGSPALHACLNPAGSRALHACLPAGGVAFAWSPAGKAALRRGRTRRPQRPRLTQRRSDWCRLTHDVPLSTVRREYPVG
jgi:glycine/D-amino acid oxidase-like deaminating enzyme